MVVSEGAKGVMRHVPELSLIGIPLGIQLYLLRRYLDPLNLHISVSNHL